MRIIFNTIWKNRPFRFLLLVAGGMTLTGLMNIGIIVTAGLADRATLSLLYPVVNELSGTYTFGAILPGMIYAITVLPITRANLPRRLPLHFLLAAAFGLLHTYLMVLTRTPLYDVLNMGSFTRHYGVPEYRYLMELLKQISVYWLTYGAVSLYGTIRSAREQEIRGARLEEQLTAARLEALQLQLNPHFLFNTLNMISSVMYTDIQKADRMMTSLSDLLRMTLQRGHRVLHSLDTELRVIDLYLKIMKGRFGDRLTTGFDISPETRQAAIPGFLLQPLVENAVKHGTEQTAPVHIFLSARRRDGHLSIRLEDEGAGMPANSADTPRGTGLSNTARRLRTLYDRDMHFSYGNRDGGGFFVSLDIPFQISDEIIGYAPIENSDR